MLIALTLRNKRLTVLKGMVTTSAAGPCNINAHNDISRKLARHDDVIKWNNFRVTGHLCGELTGHRTKASDADFVVSLIRAWINGWVNSGETGELRRYRPHDDVTVMKLSRLRTARICDQIVNIILILTEAFGLKETYHNQINVTLKFKTSNGQYISNASLNC